MPAGSIGRVRRRRAVSPRRRPARPARSVPIAETGRNDTAELAGGQGDEGRRSTGRMSSRPTRASSAGQEVGRPSLVSAPPAAAPAPASVAVDALEALEAGPRGRPPGPRQPAPPSPRARCAAEPLRPQRAKLNAHGLELLAGIHRGRRLIRAPAQQDRDERETTHGASVPRQHGVRPTRGASPARSVSEPKRSSPPRGPWSAGPEHGRWSTMSPATVACSASGAAHGSKIAIETG